MQDEQDCAQLGSLPPKESFSHLPPGCEPLCSFIAPPRAGNVHFGIQTTGTCLWQTAKLLRLFQELWKNYLSTLPKKHFLEQEEHKENCCGRNCSCSYSVRYHLAPTPPLMLSNTVLCMWKYVFKCVCYYWKQQGDTDCIHDVCTVLSITEAQILPWLLKAVLTNSLFKSHQRQQQTHCAGDVPSSLYHM